jgi:N-acetylgalactosamine-N,N'-diacetylbacillosaminyl-diphospho-undecaprenol 4-alpha-N-acetylgalactosaminyltransferase
MKIVFLINSLRGGGAERVVSTLASHLARENTCEVLIITLEKAPIAYALPASVQVRSLRSGVLCVGPGKLLFLPVLAAELGHLLKKARADAVISFLVRSNFVHVLSSWLGNRVPLVLSECCVTDSFYSTQGLPGVVMQRLVRGLYNEAQSIIAVSEAVRDGLIRMGVDGRKVQTIGNPVPLEEIAENARATPSMRSPGGKVRLVTVGSLTEVKDQETLIAAIPKIKEKFDVHLTIVGEGPLREHLERVAARLGASDDVTFAGWVKNPFAVVARSDLFVLSSRTEGFGNVLVEAMACGTPVISTDCPGSPRQLLDHGRHGVLTPVGDSSAIAEAVVALMTDPVRYRRFREGGYGIAARFDVAGVAQQYLNVVQPRSIAPSRGPAVDHRTPVS